MEKEIKLGIRVGLSLHRRRNKVMAFTVTDETLKRTQDSLKREI
jgi:hypothetical protein